MTSQLAEQRLDAVIKSAQYLAALDPRQDIWAEFGKIGLHFLQSDLAVFAAPRRNGRLVFHHCVGIKNCSQLHTEASGVIHQVLESGFLATETLLLDTTYAVVFLPLTVEGRTVCVMALGKRGVATLDRELLNLYLAVAGLFGSTLARLTSQHRFFVMADNVPEMLFQLVRYPDGSLEFGYVSGGSRTALELTPPDLLSDPDRFLSRLLPEERAEFEKAVATAGGRLHRIFRSMDADGKLRYLLCNAMPSWQEDGSIVWDGALQDITEQHEMEEERKHYLLRLERSMEATIEAIASTIEKRDPYTAGHQRRVADLTRHLGEEMDLPPDEIHGIALAASIHDIGKIHIPAEILSFPGELGPIEYELVKTHARIGYDILKITDFPWPVAEMVLQHHERMDGSGYPNQLKGDQVLLGARIIAVADVVESIASFRPYRPARTIEDAMDEIQSHRGTLYDPAVVDACLRLFTEKHYRIAVS